MWKRLTRARHPLVVRCGDGLTALGRHSPTCVGMRIVFASEAILNGADGCVSLHSLSLWVPRQSFCCRVERRARRGYRLRLAPCGDLMPIPVRDLHGMKTTRRSFTRKPTTQ